MTTPSSALPRHEFIEIRGLRHRITRWGPESADPILLLHGFLDNGETFQFLVDALPRDWSFAAPDWRGFGDSAGLGDSYWFPDYLADLEQLLLALNPNGAARVIGHSMGGNVALMYGGVRPQALRWIVSLEGFGLLRTRTDDAPARYGEWLDSLQRGPRRSRYRSVEQLASILRSKNPRLTRERAAFVARAWTRPVDGEFELRVDPAHRHVNPILYRREETEACWRQIKAPVLLVLAEHSEFLRHLGADGTPEAFGHHIAQLLVRVLPGVGHMMHYEDPELVAREICAFLHHLPKMET